MSSNASDPTMLDVWSKILQYEDPPQKRNENFTDEEHHFVDRYLALADKLLAAPPARKTKGKAA